ncbi:MAG: DUF3822 family protein [Bacteroidales bacterium]|jgi:hypothetical protein|nr:DUF3822 family protein [Bacteroidales bacterium]
MSEIFNTSRFAFFPNGAKVKTERNEIAGPAIKGENALTEMFITNKGETIRHSPVDGMDAELFYICNVSETGKPCILFMVESLLADEKHDIYVNFCRDDNSTQIAVSTAGKITFANSFRTTDFTTMLYYVMFVAKSLGKRNSSDGAVFLGEFEEDEKNMLKRYFISPEIKSL